MGAMAVEVVTLPVPLRLEMVAGAVMEAWVALLRLLTKHPFNLIIQYPFLLKVWVAQAAPAAILQAVFILEPVAVTVEMAPPPTRFLLAVRVL
jgi:hypothetical protein